MTTKSKPMEQRSEFTESVIEMFQKNGMTLTIAAIAIIMVSGIAIVENRENWWVLLIGIAVIFTAFFLYMNARVFIKIAVVSALNLFMSTIAFQVGSFADQTGTGGLVWMSSTLFLFFSTLAISYVLTSAKSRWGTIGVSTVLGFIITYTLGIGGINLSLSALISTILSLIVFVILYKTGQKNKYSTTEMPTNILTEDLSDTIIQLFESNGWGATSLKDENYDTGTVIVWDDRGYVLYPIYMDEAFSSVETKKTAMLAYKENNINPWLLNIVFSKLPIWKSRNANLNLVLLDLSNNNGKSAKVIGVKVPDNNKPIPVGIIPAQSIFEPEKSDFERRDDSTKKPMSNRQRYLQKKKNSKISLKDPDDIITMIDAEMSLYTKPLKTKQKIAVSRIGKVEEDISKDSTKLFNKKKKQKESPRKKSLKKLSNSEVE